MLNCINMISSRFLREILPKRNITTTIRCRKAEEDSRSLYERDEAGKPARVIHGKPYPEWRTPWSERKGEFYSKFKVFVEKNPNIHVLSFMQRIPDVTMKDMKDFWTDLKEKNIIDNQRFISERVEILGSNLAAAHFVCYRGGGIWLKGKDDWVTGDPTKNTEMFPNKFTDNFFIERIDCSPLCNGGLRYDGLLNFANLNFLKHLSLKNNSHIDDWGLDRIAGQNGETLEYLDISGCGITYRSVYSIARMPQLKVLLISNFEQSKEMVTAISLLEELNTKLIVKQT